MGKEIFLMTLVFAFGIFGGVVIVHSDYESKIEEYVNNYNNLEKQMERTLLQSCNLPLFKRNATILTLEKPKDLLKESK